MAWVTQQLIDVWNAAQFVGENTPSAAVSVQMGHWVRNWWPWDGPPVKAQIWAEGGYGPASYAQDGYWWAKWYPTTDWHVVPNVTSIKRTKDLSQNGITILEVTLDASDFVPKEGALGDAYHVIAPGWLAPTRNYIAPGRPNPRWELGPWAPDGHPGRLSDSVVIRVWQGYGRPHLTNGSPALDGGQNGAWTFRGMIDDVDLDSDPNTLTITARNGKLLTDQRVFGTVKSPHINDPVTFYDSLAATQLTMVGSAAYASSYDPDHPPKNVLDPIKDQWNIHSPSYQTTWRSGKEITATRMEWIEIRLPQGRYDEFWIAAPPGLQAYAGIYAKPIQHYVSQGPGFDLVLQEEPATMDGHALKEGWVDLGAKTRGPHGGWPYVRAFMTGSSDTPGIDRPHLEHSFELGKHSILRVGLTRPHGSGLASVGDLHGLKRFISKEIEQQRFILVDDASEIVKVVLRWAGYQQWDIEEAGVRLSDGTNYGPQVVGESSGRLMFNRQSFLIDIIQAVAKQLGFIFFIADPVDADSEGIPTFRRDSSLLKDNHYIAAKLNEGTMLTGLKVKHTDADRPYVIRVRGKTAAARDGGFPLGGDTVARIMAVYVPPWAFGSRTGGVLRHVVYEDDQLITFSMCLFGALMIGMNSALAMHTAVAEIPAHPMIELDDQVSILDEPTATNSRLWVVKTEDTMLLGEGASWVETLEGALLDSEDLHAVIDQSLGRAPITLGTGTRQTTIEKVNWKRVIDPDTGNVSGYRAPVLQSIGRAARTR
jgi:hypothetical protein